MRRLSARTFPVNRFCWTPFAPLGEMPQGVPAQEPREASEALASGACDILAEGLVLREGVDVLSWAPLLVGCKLIKETTPFGDKPRKPRTSQFLGLRDPDSDAEMKPSG